MAKNTAKNWFLNPYYTVIADGRKYTLLVAYLINKIGDESRIIFTGGEIGILAKDDDWLLPKEELINLVFHCTNEARIFTVANGLAEEPEILEDEHSRYYRKVNGKPVMVYQD